MTTTDSRRTVLLASTAIPAYVVAPSARWSDGPLSAFNALVNGVKAVLDEPTFHTACGSAIDKICGALNDIIGKAAS